MIIDKLERDFLELVAVSIDYPCRLMNRLGCSNRSAYRLIEKLISDGYIRKHKKDNLCSLRITKKGQSILLKENPERFEKLMEKRRYCKSEVVKRLRWHRIASTYTSMRNAEVGIFFDEKPNLFSKTENALTTIDKPVFYSAVEIKDLGPECTKIKFSRAVGIMLCSNEVGFIVYNTDNSLMKWSSRAEQRLYGVLTGILLNNSVQVNDFAGIMIGNNMGTALTQLLSSGGVKNCFFKVDNTFNEFYYIPEDNDGDVLLRLLTNYEKRRKIRDMVMQSFRITNNMLPFASDGVDSEERATLLAYEFDMEKIRKFKSGIEMFEEPGIVICFDFQREVLEKYFGKLARIVTLNREWMVKELDMRYEK